MSVLSIQSLVAYGHVGHSAPLFPRQRLGFEVWPVVTVHLGGHTGYGAARGPLLGAADMAEVLAGVEDRGAFEALSRTVAAALRRPAPALTAAASDDGGAQPPAPVSGWSGHGRSCCRGCRSPRHRSA